MEIPRPVVLHIGDSMVESGFSQALRARFEAAGSRYVVRARHSLYSGTILRALGVSELLLTLRPALVIVNIGANEMQMPQPEDHAGAIRRVARVVGETSCVWVTPPPPKAGETGIVRVMARESSPCRVFDSTSLSGSLQRGPDGVHPTAEAGAQWADAFWNWLQLERDPARGSWALRPRSDTTPETRCDAGSSDSGH